MGVLGRSTVSAIRSISALILAVQLVSSIVSPIATLAKDFAVIGIVDCGARSGKACPDGTTVIGVRTDQISGKLQTFKVDIAWIAKHAPRLHQDDELCVEVRDDARTDGVLQAIAFIEKCDAPTPPRRRVKDDDVVAAEPERESGTGILLCSTEEDDSGRGATGSSTESTFVVEMFSNDAQADIFFRVTSGTVRFQVFYAGDPAPNFDSGFRPVGSYSDSFLYGPADPTTVTVVTTLGSPGSAGSFEVFCPFID